MSRACLTVAIVSWVTQRRVITTNFLGAARMGQWVVGGVSGSFSSALSGSLNVTVPFGTQGA